MNNTYWLSVMIIAQTHHTTHFICIRELYSELFMVKGGSRLNRADVQLLSMSDGRQHLVEVTRSLAARVASNQMKCTDITPSNVDQILQGKLMVHLCGSNYAILFKFQKPLMGCFYTVCLKVGCIGFKTGHNIILSQASANIYHCVHVSARF